MFIYTQKHVLFIKAPISPGVCGGLLIPNAKY